MNAARGYRPDIDGLRAIAVSAVLLFHCSIPGFSGGFVGVDIFFVISGFLITGHIADDIIADRMSILNFYERRIRRIVPALFVTLVLTTLASAFLLLPSYMANESAALLASATALSNIYFWKSSNYFAAESAFQPLLHTWSLAVEEQFYLIIPLLMTFFKRLLQRRWVLLFLPLCIASFALSVYATTTAPTANFYLLPTRAWELGLGSLVATTPLPIIKGRWTAEIVGAAGLLLILFPIFLFNDDTAFPGLNALWPCMGAALLIYLGRTSRTVTTIALGQRPLVAIGLISYSLYLVHWPIISLTQYIEVGPLTTPEIISVLIGSVLLAYLMWRFVERPFRRTSRTLTQRRIVAGGLAAICMAGLLGAVGIENKGFPSRFPGFTEHTIPGGDQWKVGQCFLEGNPDYRKWSLTDCTRTATGSERVLLWGDSFAAQYVPGILANANTLNATIIQYTAAGCPPVLSYRSYARTLCTEFNAHALDIIRNEKVTTVIIAARWTDMRERGLNQIRSTLSALDSMGVRVIMIGQSPEFAADVRVLSALKGARGSNVVNQWNVTFPLSINDQLRSIAGNNAFVNPMIGFCISARCVYEDHGTFLFQDYGHYSTEGSRRAVQKLFVETGLLDGGVTKPSA